jgi:hypothetical protein
MRRYFSLVILLCLTALTSTSAFSQDVHIPIDGYWDENSINFSSREMQSALDEVDWKIFPIADKAFYPIEGGTRDSFETESGFQSFNSWLKNEPANPLGCLRDYKLGEMYHLAEDMFGDDGNLILNTMVGKPIYHHLKVVEGYPGDAVIVMHKLPNGAPIFSMLGHLHNGFNENYKFTDDEANPRYTEGVLNPLYYLYGGENFFWVNKSTKHFQPVPIHKWTLDNGKDNTHIHWELRRFINHEGLYNQGYSTSSEYPRHGCNTIVGPGYLPIDEYETNTEPSKLGWHDPLQFTDDINAGKYGRVVDGPSKQSDGITVCNLVNQCSFLPEGINLDPLLVADLDKVLIPTSFYLEFTQNNDKVFCLNSDGENVRNYKYPDSMGKIVDSTRSVFVRAGNCVNESGSLIKSDPLEGAGLFPRVWHCEEGDHAIVGVVGFNGEKFCYPVRIGHNWIQRQGYTIGFPIKKLELYSFAPVQLYDRGGNCHLIKSTTNDFTGSEDFYRMVIMKVEDKDIEECQEYSDMDFPVVRYLSHFEGKSNMLPKLVWKTSKSSTAPDYEQWLYVFHNRLLSDRILIPSGVTESYLPDHGEGEYWFFLVTTPIGVPLTLGVDYLWWNTYEVINTNESKYVGFELSQVIYSFDVPNGVDITIPPNQVGQLWGSGFHINGYQYGDIRSRSINATTIANNYVFKLNPGTYSISNWLDGAIEIGTDYIGGYGEYLALTNSQVLSQSWQTTEYEHFFAPPTSTPTSTPLPTFTLTPTPSATPSPSSTSTPIVLATDTPTLTVTPTGTVLPTATFIAPTLTPTATETVTVPGEGCPCTFFLPLIQQP